MANPKYRCVNYGECEKADAREKFEIAPGAEPVCPECDRPLRLEAGVGGGGGKGLPKPLLLGLAALILIGGGIAAVVALKSYSEPEEISVEAALQEVWPWLK